MGLPTLDKEVKRIADYCMEGKTLTHADAVYLCDVEPFTPEGHVISYVARERHFKTAGGIAEVHGQIGMDANPCPANCEFCSFAVVNNARPNERHEMSREAILRHAHDYYDNGANCLTLMITNSYSFDQFLGHIEAVHKELPDFPIMANMSDFDLAMAKEMKSVGVGSVYHAIRMGEGTINNLSVEARVRSITAAHEAGLKVSTCTELITPTCKAEDIVAALEREVSLEPESGFAGGFIAVPGTLMFDAPRYSWSRINVFGNILRLMTPEGKMPFGTGNHSWAEVGTNPRDDKNETERGGLGPDLLKSRMEFENKEWTVPFGPSKFW